MPATIVGSAKGRSMSALMTLLPRKRSRTRTQAMSVPATALIAATTSDAPSVSSSAARAGRLVAACQKAARPPSSERTTTAASGGRTMRLSQTVATPRPRPPADAPGSVRERPRRRGARAAGRASLGSGDPRALLDLRERPLVGIEEGVVDLAPAAEVADREQPRRRREALGV